MGMPCDGIEKFRYIPVEQYIRALKQSIRNYPHIKILVSNENALDYKDPINEDVKYKLFDRIGKMTKESEILIFPGTCTWTKGGKLRKTMPVCGDGGVILEYDKSNTNTDDLTWKRREFEFEEVSANHVPFFAHKFRNNGTEQEFYIGTEICADIGTLANDGISHLDFHIMSTNYLKWLPENIDPTRSGGYQVLCDGNNFFDQPFFVRRCTIKKIENGGTPYIIEEHQHFKPKMHNFEGYEMPTLYLYEINPFENRETI